jgi:hypothetical protein
MWSGGNEDKRYNCQKVESVCKATLQIHANNVRNGSKAEERENKPEGWIRIVGKDQQGARANPKE